MKKQLLCLCAIAGAGLAVQAAEAQSESGYYTKFGVGVAFQGDIKLKELDGIKFPLSLTGPEILDLADQLGFDLPPDVNLDDITATVGKPKLKTDAGLNLDLAMGYRFNKSLSLELQTGLIYNSLKSMELTATVSDGVETASQTVKEDLDLNLYQVPILANVIYTIPLEGDIKPYIGAGVGGVMTIVEGEGDSQSDFTFAWQVMAGVDYKLNNNWSAGVAYKLLGTGQSDWDGVKSDPIYTHSILATVGYSF